MGGAPSFGRQGLQSIGGMLLNIAARSYGDAAVAGMSIVSRIFMFIISVAIGVGQGLQPVAAFNYGARKFRRVQKAAVFTMGAAFCMLVVLVSLCWVNSDASSACSVMTRMLPPWRCPPSTISALPFCCSRSLWWQT